MADCASSAISKTSTGECDPAHCCSGKTSAGALLSQNEAVGHGMRNESTLGHRPFRIAMIKPQVQNQFHACLVFPVRDKQGPGVCRWSKQDRQSASRFWHASRLGGLWGFSVFSSSRLNRPELSFLKGNRQ